VQFEVAQRNFLSAQSQVDVAIAKLELARRDLRNTSLTAPFDGQVAERLPTQIEQEEMFGKITEFAIQANRITILVLVAIPLIGLVVFLNYPRQEDPSIEIRQAIVTASHPGMKVYQVEDLITRTLEEKIREIGEVDDVWSSSQDGRTTIYVEVDDVWSSSQDGRTTIYVEVDDWVTGPESSASGRCCATR
jgi:multidrug efflux pump subunit AcrA (membrane-fusion protein)